MRALLGLAHGTGAALAAGTQELRYVRVLRCCLLNRFIVYVLVICTDLSQTEGCWLRQECENMCVFWKRFFIALAHDATHRELHAIPMGGDAR